MQEREKGKQRQSKIGNYFTQMNYANKSNTDMITSREKLSGIRKRKIEAEEKSKHYPNSPYLAFPVLLNTDCLISGLTWSASSSSSSSFPIDINEEISIMAEAINIFLSNNIDNGDICLVLVVPEGYNSPVIDRLTGPGREIERDSGIGKKQNQKMQEHSSIIRDQRFSCVKDDLVSLRAMNCLRHVDKGMKDMEHQGNAIAGVDKGLKDMDHRFSVLANPCNWRFLGRGNKVTTIIHQKAGVDYLETQTRLLYGTRAQTSKAYTVELDANCELSAKEGVKHIIHVLAPNMDPRFPDCVEDLGKAATLLKDTYLNLFGEYLKVVQSYKQLHDGIPNKTGRAVATGAAPASLSFKPYEASSCRSKKASMGGWADALYQYIRSSGNDGKLEGQIYYQDEKCVVVYDAFPKAKYHLLLIPRESYLNVKSISTIDAGEVHNLKKLQELHILADNIVLFLSRQCDKKTSFKTGYHSIPSLYPLHLHIVSNDFDSDWMKNKKHWNSFTSEFFVDASLLEKTLELQHHFRVDPSFCDSLLKRDLKCHKCKRNMKNMVDLKNHIKLCDSS